MNIVLIESKAKIKTSMDLSIGFKSSAKDLGLKKPHIKILKLEKLTLFSDIIFTLLFGLLSLVKLTNLNISNFSIKQ